MRFLALGLIPLMAVSLFAGYRIAQIQLDAVGFRSRFTARTVAARVETYLSQTPVALAQLGHLAGTVGRKDELVSALTHHEPSVESVFLVNPEGRIEAVGISPTLAAKAQDFLRLDESRDPLFLQAKRTGRASWSGVFTSPVSGKRVLGLAMPYESGIALATIDIESFASALRDIDLDPNSSIVVTDGDGRVLFHSNESIARLRPNWSNRVPIQAGIEGKAGRFEYVQRGEPMIGSTSLVSDVGWVVLVQQPRSAALRPAINVWVGTMLAIAAVAVIAVFTAILFSRTLSQPISRLAGAAKAIEHGKYEVEMPESQIKEITGLSTSIERMAQAVQDREMALLESLKLLSIEADDKARALKRLSAMSTELAVTEERERRRLAEELHDRVSQVLAVAKMRLGLIRDGTDTSEQNAAMVDDLLAEAVAQTRTITTELASPVLYELGLGAAVTDMCERVGAQYGLKIHVETDTACECLGDDAKAAMLRSARELVMNVVKHAQTDEAWVVLAHDSGVITLEVRDQGRGMSDTRSADSGGFGLFSIEERLTQLDGQLSVDSALDKGTTVTVRVRCPEESAADC